MNNASSDAVRHFSATVREFDAYYRDRPDFEERLPVWRDLLNRYAVPGGLAIDMGCGTGIFTFYLARLAGQVVGIDGSENMIAHCNSLRDEQGVDNVRFAEGLLPDIDTRDLGQADLVISSSVVEYVADLDRSLALFSRLLKPGASLVLSMPNALSLSRNVERLRYRIMERPEIYRYIKHFSTPSLLQKRLRPYGLVLQESHYYAHPTRIARAGRRLRMPGAVTADLFVAAFRKRQLPTPRHGGAR